ncbi:VCBS repeat-containing protein, partial [bacterium]|nr:VCBS repeat-containing protein [bacterium]
FLMRYAYIIFFLLLFSSFLLADVPDVIGNYPSSAVHSGIFRAFDLGELDGWPQSAEISGTGPGGGIKAFDLNGDGETEIILGSTDGLLYVWNFDGTNFSSFPVDVGSPIRSPAAIGNINSTPEPEIIVTTTTGVLAAYDISGEPCDGFPRTLSSGFTFNSPVLWDFNGDKELEIIASDDSLYVISGDGTNFMGFPVKVNSAYGTVASPAVGDIDNDQVAEIVLEGWDSLFAFDAYGSLEPGFPVGLTGEYDGFSYSAPTLVDFNRDGYLEIIAGYHESGGGSWHGKVAVWSYTGEFFTDTLSSSWYPVAFYDYGSWTYSTPAVGDIDNDGEPEYAMTSHNGDLMLRNGNATSPGSWPVYTGYSNLECSAVLGDVNSDGDLDVIIGTNGGSLLMLGYNSNCAALDSFPLSATAAATVNSPLIMDLNGDGSIELVMVGIDGIVHLWRLLGDYTPGTMPWTQIHHDPWNTGWYHPLPPDSLVLNFDEPVASLEWSPILDPDFVGFNVYRASDSTGLDWERLTPEPIDVTYFTDTVSITDTSFCYFVTGMSECGLEGPRSDIVWVTDTTGIDDVVLKPVFFEVIIYPNPFNSAVSISAPEGSIIKIYDLLGNSVSTFASEKKFWQPETSLGSGVYFIRAQLDDEWSQTKKVIYLK